MARQALEVADVVRAHGAAFATYLSATLDDYRLLQGAEAITEYESSPGFPRGFCATCGSVVPMILGAAESRRAVIPAGCLDDDPGLRPAMHIFVASKAPWHVIADALPRHDAYPAASGKPEVARPAKASETPGHLHGSCLCGEIAYEITEPFRKVYNCHCLRCQKARAAAHTTNGFTSFDGVRFLKGEDLLVHYKLPEARFFGQTFCRVCGSGMPRLSQERGIAGIPLGSLDDDPGRGADDHIFTGSKAPWYEIAGDLPQHEEMPTG